MRKSVYAEVYACVCLDLSSYAQQTTQILNRERRNIRDSSFNGKLHVIVIFDGLDVQGDYNCYGHDHIISRGENCRSILYTWISVRVKQRV